MCLRINVRNPPKTGNRGYVPDFIWLFRYLCNPLGLQAPGRPPSAMRAQVARELAALRGRAER